VSYAQLEPYHDLFEKLFGVSGQAGNIGGKKLPGGNPFEAPRSGPYPQAALQVLESGLVFKQACDHAGLSRFSPGRSQLIRGLYQPGWAKAGAMPVLRPLRALYLRGQCQGLAAGLALPHAAPAQEL
jgi:gluconate 2-dehydrogenase alpha chain